MRGNGSRPGPRPGANTRDFNTPFRLNEWIGNDCGTDNVPGMIWRVG